MTEIFGITGQRLLRLQDSAILNNHDQRLAHVEDGRLVNARGEILATFEQNSVRNSRGQTLVTVEGEQILGVAGPIGRVTGDTGRERGLAAVAYVEFFLSE